MTYYNTSYRTPLATITCVIVRLTVILPEGAYACMSPKRRETWEPNGCDLMSENVNNDSSRLSKIHRPPNDLPITNNCNKFSGVPAAQVGYGTKSLTDNQFMVSRLRSLNYLL